MRAVTTRAGIVLGHAVQRGQRGPIVTSRTRRWRDVAIGPVGTMTAHAVAIDARVDTGHAVLVARVARLDDLGAVLVVAAAAVLVLALRGRGLRRVAAAAGLALLGAVRFVAGHAVLVGPARQRRLRLVAGGAGHALARRPVRHGRAMALDAVGVPVARRYGLGVGERRRSVSSPDTATVVSGRAKAWGAWQLRHAGPLCAAPWWNALSLQGLIVAGSSRRRRAARKRPRGAGGNPGSAYRSRSPPGGWGQPCAGNSARTTGARFRARRGCRDSRCSRGAWARAPRPARPRLRGSRWRRQRPRPCGIGGGDGGAAGVVALEQGGRGNVGARLAVTARASLHRGRRRLVIAVAARAAGDLDVGRLVAGYVLVGVTALARRRAQRRLLVCAVGTRRSPRRASRDSGGRPRRARPAPRRGSSRTASARGPRR